MLRRDEDEGDLAAGVRPELLEAKVLDDDPGQLHRPAQLLDERPAEVRARLVRLEHLHEHLLQGGPHRVLGQPDALQDRSLVAPGWHLLLHVSILSLQNASTSVRMPVASACRRRSPAGSRYSGSAGEASPRGAMYTKCSKNFEPTLS